MTCFIFDSFDNLLLFVEQHIEQVREEFPGGGSLKVESIPSQLSPLPRAA